jgi:hypothetical protein
MASTTLIGTLGGVALTQWNQRRVYQQQALTGRLPAIREERNERILKFMDATQAVEDVAEKRFYQGRVPEGFPALVHQLWLREKGVNIVAGETLRGATKAFADKLQDAVYKGTDGMKPHEYYEDERSNFLVAARSELENGEQ